MFVCLCWISNIVFFVCWLILLLLQFMFLSFILSLLYYGSYIYVVVGIFYDRRFCRSLTFTAANVFVVFLFSVQKKFRWVFVCPWSLFFFACRHHHCHHNYHHQHHIPHQRIVISNNNNENETYLPLFLSLQKYFFCIPPRPQIYFLFIFFS